MKKWTLILIAIIVYGVVYAQSTERINSIGSNILSAASTERSKNDDIFSVGAIELLNQSFSSTSFPPAGWTIDKRSGNWLRYNTAYAGGSAPEALLTNNPIFNDTSRFISPKVNTQGLSVLFLKFKHYVSFYKDKFIIGVATRSKSNGWSTVWSKTVQANISAGEAFVFINNADVGQADFQFCFYFQGNSENMNYLCIDDISLAPVLDHDISILQVTGLKQFSSGASYVAGANIINLGKNTESFNIQCKITDQFGNILFTCTKQASNIQMGATTLVSFDPYVLKENNSLYNVKITSQLSGDLNPDNDSLSLYINTYTTERDLVLLEIGTGTWCTFCPGASMGADDLLKNGGKVGVVKYHSGDKFETPEAKSRISYYSITGFPTAIFDGTRSLIGGSHFSSMYNNYLLIYNNQFAVKTPISLGINGSPTSADSYKLSIELKKLAPIASDDLRLFVALTESEIAFNWQDQKVVNFAERLLLPGVSGTKVDLKSQDKQTLQLSFNVIKDWNISNLELVAWVQDTKSKEVYNCSKVKITDLKTPSEFTFLTQKTSKADTLGKEIIFNIELKNISSEQQSYFLVRKKNNLPSNWTSALCMGNNCFAPFVDSVATTSEFNSIPLQPNETRDVSIHVFTGTNNGTANISIEAGSIRNPANRIKLDFTASTIITEVKVDDIKINKYTVFQNYPNPFNPSTIITYKLPVTSKVKLTVFNSLGQEVEVLENGIRSSGLHEIYFNASGISSGLYFYSIEAISAENNYIFRDTKKMIIAK